ncbi:aminotransferase class V-fold PLP-dependent enzyme [Sandarakinorhabdus limnophila]|uniref:aminotransferase class V-fold PLP-dependent enzyme n=1 Tax=Sandarakinorhabdus limnophila TaxID=210512 RepID=UPI0003B5ACD7|nr:aminotransferase class V-fold PLP-dependent enzyme [Sandarakinorhabdus limnophila]
MQVSRRDAMMLAGAAAAAAGAAPARALSAPGVIAPDDEAGWARIGALYPSMAGPVTQLEHGYWGNMALQVAETHKVIVERLNRETSIYARRAMRKDQAVVKARAAQAMGVQPEEIGFCRNAAEGLQALISQFQGVAEGDAILWSDSDYDTSHAAMRTLAKSRRATPVMVNLPRAPTRENVIAAYAAAIKATQRLKFVLLTHGTHKSGMVVPVTEIAALAKAAGAMVLVDCAQSFRMRPFVIPDFGADYAVLNFHKWTGAPVGVAGFWIRPGAAPMVAAAAAEPDAKPEDVQAKVHQGTLDYAPQLTLPAALDFQEQVLPVPMKLARLQWLRNRWVQPLRGLSGLEIMLGDDPATFGAITSFRIAGHTSTADNIAITDTLFNQYRIMTVHRSGLADGACVRVTPGLFTKATDCDRLVAALKDLVPKIARG